MRRVAGEQHAAVAEAFHPLAGERVDADPLELELGRSSPSSALHARGSRSRASSLRRDRRPSRAGNRCARRCRAAGAAAPTGCGWKGGSNQNQRSAGKSAFILTSAIRKRSRNTRPLLSRPSIARSGAARAVAGDDVVALQPVVALRRLDASARRDPPRGSTRDDLVLPAQIDSWQRGGALDQIALDVVLLQVDERRAMVARLRAAG